MSNIGLPFNRLGVPRNKISKISKMSGKMRNLPCRRWKRKWNDEMLQLAQTIGLFLFSIEKKKMRANARNFPDTRLRENVIMWLYQKIQILSWNLTFRCQVLAIAFLIIDTIAWNIFVYFPQLMTPQSKNEYEMDETQWCRKSRDRIATSYLPLLNYNASTMFLKILKT